MVRITLTNEIGLASQLEVSASETIANLKVKQNKTCLCLMTRSRHLTPHVLEYADTHSRPWWRLRWASQSLNSNSCSMVMNLLMAKQRYVL